MLLTFLSWLFLATPVHAEMCYEPVYPASNTPSANNALLKSYNDCLARVLYEKNKTACTSQSSELMTYVWDRDGKQTCNSTCTERAYASGDVFIDATSQCHATLRASVEATKPVSVPSPVTTSPSNLTPTNSKSQVTTVAIPPTKSVIKTPEKTETVHPTEAAEPPTLVPVVPQTLPEPARTSWWHSVLQSMFGWFRIF